MWKEANIRWLIFGACFIGIFEFLSLAGIFLQGPFAFFFFLGFTLFFGHQTILNGLKALLSFNLKSINFLMLIATFGAFYLKEYPEGAIVIILFTLAEKLEDIGIEKSKSALDVLIKKMPKAVYVQEVARYVDVQLVNVGDIILIKPSEMIPLDGVVLKGSSLVDESPITGEPLFQDKRAQDLVFAGSLNKQGVLEIQVTKLAKDSTIEKIKEMTFQAFQNKAKTQKFIEKFSSVYTPLIILTASFWVLFNLFYLQSPFEPSFKEALTLLVIACPCALVISTPISIFSAIGNASKQGALIKGGKFLEAIGQIKAIALDKTRTLTYGRPKVSDVVPLGSNSKELLISCAAGIEKFSEHPLAQSIVDYAENEKYTLHEVENFESIVGKGAKADCLVCEDQHHCIGKLQFILEEHKVPTDVIELIDSYQNQGKTVVAISTNKEVEGIIALEDEVRPDSKKLIDELHQLGISTIMLTGDHQNVAKSVAQQVGITEVKADLLPQDKATLIAELLQQYKVVAMFGDGVNDAPALALSSVGISMSSLGSDTALEAASIVLLNDRLELIPFLVRLGRKTLTTVKVNTSFAVFVKFVIVALALCGISNLALAIFADVGVTVLVILNSLRLLEFKSPATILN